MKRLFVSVALFWQIIFVFGSQSIDWNPISNPNATYVFQNARFTVLTDYLLRLEYSQNGIFEDSATIAIVNRNLPVPEHTVGQTGDSFSLKTKSLSLKYEGSDPFSASNLQIQFSVNGVSSQWIPGMINSGNLLGTLRTLDGVNGSIELNCTLQTDPTRYCTWGLVSRLGWNVVDDSNSPILEPNPDWKLWVTGRNNSNDQDWYFFGHGHLYSQALQDFTSISGNIPLPPRYLFGIFFSRYWAYSSREFMDLINEYEVHQTPLDVLVTDMDWHETFYKEAAEGQKDQAGLTPGWTGYTWDDRLFPDPGSFLEFCKSKGLKNTLNLHPASGVQPHEEMYPQMATAMGIDPASQVYVPFDIVNTSFADNLHDIMLRPLNEQGIDFWWLDWQQSPYTQIPGVNPTIWLNHVFFNNFARWQSEQRPLLLHRWGGLGNHRYQAGFSGDVTPSWASLEFQVKFTASATNVGFSFWSHDIGGHTRPSPPELYTRWIQWGIFSPVFRPHCTKNADNDRRIWTYPLANFKIMQKLVTLRSQLVPYLYTCARLTVDSSVGSIVRPMYYEFPEKDEAYQFTEQYLFGPSFLVSPVVSPGDNVTGLASKTTWLPQGKWIEWFTGRILTGPMEFSSLYALNEVPIFAREGSIVPYQPLSKKRLFGAAGNPPSRMGFFVFPLISQRKVTSQFYEDDGNNVDYLNSKYSWTSVAFERMTNVLYAITIQATDGSFPGMFEEYSYEITLVNMIPPMSVLVNGNPIPYDPSGNPDSDGWKYDGNKQNVIITIATPYDRSQPTQIQLQFPQPQPWTLLDGAQQKITRAQAVETLFDYQWGTPNQMWQEDYVDVLYLATLGDRMTGSPESVPELLATVNSLVGGAVSEIMQLETSPLVVKEAVALLTF